MEAMRGFEPWLSGHAHASAQKISPSALRGSIRKGSNRSPYVAPLVVQTARRKKYPRNEGGVRGAVAAIDRRHLRRQLPHPPPSLSAAGGHGAALSIEAPFKATQIM